MAQNAAECLAGVAKEDRAATRQDAATAQAVSEHAAVPQDTLGPSKAEASAAAEAAAVICPPLAALASPMATGTPSPEPAAQLDQRQARDLQQVAAK
jgi:hypothetical protein